jgi:hypothetical protein
MRILPVEEVKYPQIVFTYKARNVKPMPYTGLELYSIINGEVQQKAVFTCADYICDGQVHELRHDLREFSRKGVTVNIWMRVFSTPETTPANPTELEVLSLRMESADAHPAKLEEEKPVTIKVVDEKGQAIEGATLTVDAFTNRARSAQTDRAGQATLTPYANAITWHRLQVTKASKATQVILTNEPLPSEVTMPEAVSYSGVVQNAEGKGVAGVSIVLVYPEAGPDARPYGSPNVTVLSDAQGRWQAEGLPAGIPNLTVRLSHSHYPVDKGWQTLSGSEAREGKAVLKLSREGKAIDGAKVPPDNSF